MTHTVYAFFDTDGGPLYVGCTENLRRRIREHRYRKPWWPLVADIEHSEPMEKSDALALERTLIRATRPLWNCDHNPLAAPLSWRRVLGSDLSVAAKHAFLDALETAS